ncbi:hypothetical protein AVEN_271984-1 [Araneus ventricosus]|uniref:Uncharacterized protein n=1 Tax=Araneus ventricosus TaxID=182803 RepID=A0A4Y2CD59_ARAVE|nr:hypothetical protein AVEN_271984-1 [Araneus ventricosus]
MMCARHRCTFSVAKNVNFPRDTYVAFKQRSSFNSSEKLSDVDLALVDEFAVDIGKHNEHDPHAARSNVYASLFHRIIYDEAYTMTILPAGLV